MFHACTTVGGSRLLLNLRSAYFSKPHAVGSESEEVLFTVVSRWLVTDSESVYEESWKDGG